MSIRFKTRKVGYKMPVQFVPSTVPIKLRGAVDRFKTILEGKPLGVCLQGKSIQELEDMIHLFKELPLCWGAMNRFDIYQDHILNKIDKKLQVVMDVGEVKFQDAYEKIIRVPRWKSYLANENSILITSEEILSFIKDILMWDIEKDHGNQLIIIEKCRDIRVPNSIMLYLMVLAKLETKKVILFGFDGFGNPAAFKDTPVWDATEFTPEQYCNKTLSAYYRPETTLEERVVGYQDERASDLHSNCPTFNDQFRKTYGLYCKENNLQQSEIVNCSPNALYTVFRKIGYNQLEGELH